MTSPEQYFLQTLEANGLEPLNQDEQLTKLAEESGRDLELVKLAKFFFDRTVLEGLDFETRERRWEESVKIAEAYLTQQEEDKTAAVRTVDRLLEKLATTASEYAKDIGLEASGYDLLKLAALQADTATAYEAARQKQAEQAKEASEGEGKEVDELPDFYHRFDNEKAAGLLDDPVGKGARHFLDQN